MRATKQEILGGGQAEPYVVKALNGDEVLLRPLSAAEAEEVQAAQVAGIRAKMSDLQGFAPGASGRVGEREPGRAQPRASSSSSSGTDPEIDLSEVIKGSHRAQVLAAHYGLAEPALSLEEVQAIRPQQVVEEIGEEVMVRSGLGSAQGAQLQAFRDVTARADDAEAASEREPAGADAG